MANFITEVTYRYADETHLGVFGVNGASKMGEKGVDIV